MNVFYKPLIPLFCLVVISACSSGPGEYDFQGGTMGTTWSVKLVTEQQVDQTAVQEGVQAVLDEVNARMSNWDPASDVSVFNRSPAGCYQVSPLTAEVVAASQEISRLTEGLFDATLGPLIQLWGFGAEFTADQMPNPEAIEEILSGIGYQKLHLSENQLCKDTDELFVNLSATAKGYGVDRVAEYLQQKGFDRYLVEVGGEIRVQGLNHQDQAWRIGIEVPMDQLVSGQVQQVVALDGMALATSGDYRNYFVHQGIRYSHIINPRTGYPVPQELASVTVLHQSTLWADGWATAMLALGPEKGMALAEQMDIPTYFVLRKDQGFEVQTSSSWDF